MIIELIDELVLRPIAWLLEALFGGPEGGE